MSKRGATVRRLFVGLLILMMAAPVLYWGWKAHAKQSRADGLARARAELPEALAAHGLTLGDPVFIRIFKQSSELEVWLNISSDGAWAHFQTYPICNFSGDLGPKLKEGDRQSPEGLYQIRRDQLHPTSRFHLAFNLGFPNDYDRANSRTGSYLMVHGNCVSIGCYAMTDQGIEEIYALVEAALANGQESFWVHAFPARLSDDWLAARAASEWHDYWRDLKPCAVLRHVRGNRYRAPGEYRRGAVSVFLTGPPTASG